MTPFDTKLYQSAIGSLLYLANVTRPDIAQAVHKMAQFSAQPTVEHWKLVKRILRYVQGMKGIGLLYTTDQDSSLVVYSDTDYAGDVNDRKSTSGFVFLKNGAAISWRSKKQSVVAQSTAEAEYVALFYAAQQCVWFREILVSLKQGQPETMVIYEDSQSAIQISQNKQYGEPQKPFRSGLCDSCRHTGVQSCPDDFVDVCSWSTVPGESGQIHSTLYVEFCMANCRS